MLKNNFSTILLEWHLTQSRPMPWKGSKNPYHIWLSEIILQQTRVEQGLPYFEKFVLNYPNIENLANASEDDVMKLWQGLGYYSRARNLHATAKHIAFQLNSIFPTTYKDILQLKGVGPYTASAIASFAYDLPHAVVDGNVYRVLSRIFGVKTPIDSTLGKKEFNILADELLDKAKPAAYNQAIMDFGATLCTPKSPNCKACPFQNNCLALERNEILQFPVKSKKIVKKERHFNYIVFDLDNNYTYLNKRLEKDIWQNLYEFPMIETATAVDINTLKEHEYWQKYLSNNTSYSITKTSPPMVQVLTHRKIIARFYEIKLDNSINALPFIKISKKNLNEFAFPKIISRFLEDKSLYLELF